MNPSDTQIRRLRFPFSAAAELAPEGSGAPFNVNVKEISLNGCYVETPAPLEAKTRVNLKIFGPGGFFEGTATVTDVDERKGMRLNFLDVKPHYTTLLRKWLLIAMKESQGGTN
jgi:PilZ domain